MSTSNHVREEVRSGGSTSRSLLDDARHADPAAWERLVQLYAPLVASWFRRWGISEQDVLDLLQEVFSAVARNLSRFRNEQPSDTFRGWLLTISRNRARDHFRRLGREPTAAGGTDALVRLHQILDPEALVSGAEPAGDSAFSNVLQRALDSIRGEFHERTWQAFWGVVVEGRAAADVGADLDMRPGAVRVSKSRVLLRLRRELGDVGH